MILIGYSGHAFVVHGIFHSAGKKVYGYCDTTQKDLDPYRLTYFGKEDSEDGLSAIKKHGFFVAVGENTIRERIYRQLESKDMVSENAVHASAVVDPSAVFEGNGIMIAANATVNPLAHIKTGAICNTGCIIEHECVVGEFAHIGPGAVLCGNVKVGSKTFVGANAVIRQGITIGANAMIGAGAVVVKNVEDNARVVGVPAR
jgi:sugar O-acyltransferase (sialic acid O-acetyltransferase NeuD family)